MFRDNAKFSSNNKAKTNLFVSKVISTKRLKMRILWQTSQNHSAWHVGLGNPKVKNPTKRIPKDHKRFWDLLFQSLAHSHLLLFYSKNNCFWWKKKSLTIYFWDFRLLRQKTKKAYFGDMKLFRKIIPDSVVRCIL